MTESEWLDCTQPTLLLEFLRGKASNRKIRLFSCACCRRIWHLMNAKSREIVMLAELYADGLVAENERLAARQLPSETGADAASRAAFAGHAEAMEATPILASAEVGRAEEVEQACLLREIVGNPFRPPSIDPVILRWNESTVVKLAQSIYDERAFDRMPILADALEEAGCHEAELLAHCRRPGPHVRGCWLVDLILGRELNRHAEQDRDLPQLNPFCPPGQCAIGLVHVTD